MKLFYKKLLAYLIISLLIGYICFPILFEIPYNPFHWNDKTLLSFMYYMFGVMVGTYIIVSSKNTK